MRQPRADREDKRVTRGSDTPGPRNIDEETLASRTPIREGSETVIRSRAYVVLERLLRLT